MARQRLTVGAVAAAFTLSLASAWAGQAGSRPNSGDTTGSAVPRGGGGDSGSSSSGSSGSSSSGSSSSSSSSSSSGSSGGGLSTGSSSSSGDFPRYAPPQPPQNPQRSSESGARGRAVPRGGGGSGDESGNSGSATRGASPNSAVAGVDDGGGRTRQAVPPYSRPRDGRTVQGTATERTGAIPPIDGGNYRPIVVYDPYFYGYYGGYYGYAGYCDPFYSYCGYRYGYSPYWMSAYGFGYGFFAYDPFLFSAYGSPGYAGGYSSSTGGYSSSYGTSNATGSLRLKIKPGNAQVFVDGYYVGLVDSFDGAFQRLDVEAGTHKVEIKAEGYETEQIEVVVAAGETATYKGSLKRIQ
jgi:hypothetical protein